MAWVKNIGANIYMTSPLVYNGMIYVASVDENLQGDAHIYALNGQTGELLWKYQTRNSIKNTIAIYLFICISIIITDIIDFLSCIIY